MKWDKVHIFEVRGGDEVLGRYLLRTPADRRRKELKRSGRKVKLYSLFVRKFVPLEEKRLPKGMEYWHGRIPWQIPPEAANELRDDIRGITDTFYIGSYRNGEIAQPYDRTEDLSLQPNGDTLALCYHVIPEEKTYLIIDRVDWVSVKPLCVEFSGIAEDGMGMMFTMEIEGAKHRPVPKEKPFRRGWYSTDTGALFYVGESDAKLTKEQYSDRLAGMFPYLTVYPGFSRGNWSVGKGWIPLNGGEALEDFVGVRLGMRLIEYLEVDDAREIASAFSHDNRGWLQRIVQKRPGMEPFRGIVSQNKRFRLNFRGMKMKKIREEEEYDITDRELDYNFDDLEEK